MKKIIILTMCIAIAFCASAQTQTGIVKTPGRLGSNKTVIAGKRISGATVQIKGRSAVVSKADGTFSFPIPAAKFTIQSVKKQGYVLTDPEAIARQYTHSSNPIILVMETPDQQTENKLANEKKIRRSLQRQLQEKEDELEALREENRITKEEYQQRLQQLYTEQESNEKLISDMAERYSQIDFDQLDEFNLRISDCILNGRLTEADSLLRSKGDIQSRIASLHSDEAALAAEEAELAQRQENLNKGKAGAQATKNDIAQDCYNLFRVLFLQHEIDSAKFYIEQYANIDSTDPTYQLKTAKAMLKLFDSPRTAIQYYSKVLEQHENQPNKAYVFIESCIGLAHAYTALDDTQNALYYYQKALDSPYINTDENSNKIPVILNGIGVIHAKLNQWDDAVKYYERALQSEKDEHNLATNYINIGLIMSEKGLYDEAITYYQKAMQATTDSTTTCSALVRLAAVYNSIDEYQKSLDCSREAASILESLYGTHHTATAEAYQIRGQSFFYLNRIDSALHWLGKALEINENTYGEEHLTVASLSLNISCIFEALNRYQPAIQFCEKAINTFEKYDNLYDLSSAYNHLAKIHIGLNDYDKALEYENKAIEYMRRFMPNDNHPSYGRYYSDLALIENKLGNVQEAIGHNLQAIEVYNKFSHSSRSSHHANILSNLSMCYLNTKDYDNALKYAKSALEMRRSIYGNVHSDVAQSYNNLGSIYYYIEQIDSALFYMKKAEEIWQQTNNKKDLAIISNNIGNISNKIKNYEDGRIYFEKALNLFKEIYDPGNSVFGTIYHHLGESYIGLEQYEKALEALETAYEIRCATLGEDNQNSLLTKSLIDETKELIQRQQ
jgi:tetratricopeptide (TPR) repeat protein